VHGVFAALAITVIVGGTIAVVAALLSGILRIRLRGISGAADKQSGYENDSAIQSHQFLSVLGLS
jgi:hypothetical protein